jgi:4-alpha-glucanotransferase
LSTERPLDPLDQLALLLGIEERFRDAMGEIRETTRETKRALLAAMGISAGEDRDVRRALAALETAGWRRSVPHTRVASPNPTITVDAVVPAATRDLRWSIELENGDEQSGVAACTDFTRLSSRAIDHKRWERHRVVLPNDLPYGYHQLRSNLDNSVCRLIIAPDRCWLPPAIQQGQRVWGVSTHLYLVRSRPNWGIGDFSDLRRLVQIVGEIGGEVVGLNPLHALFLDNPEHASPYSPESRLLLNVLNIDVTAVPELAQSSEARRLIDSKRFQDRLQQCQAAQLVDYAKVAGLKVQILKLLFEHSRSAPQSKLWKDFEMFRQGAGEGFEQGCLFEALRQHFAATAGHGADWHSWPAEYRDASSAAVARFAEEHSDSVTLYAWMQWLADQQLAAAAAAAGDMRIGLYRDLAVGTDSSGAEPWSNPDAVVSGAHAGAPPDRFNAAGQDWGLPPFDPRVLYETGYRNFIDVVRANMRHAGALRIDHVMALQHLYWVPRGRPASEGAYVRQPIDDLVGILALESHRNHCLIVGEDLGTVPDGFRERMMEANILSYRVLFFEQEASTGAFLPVEKYPRRAVAVAGSHDLPTIRGWWKGIDIDIQERLNLFSDESSVSEARKIRQGDRRELVRALREERLLPERGAVRMEQLAAAVHAYLARTGAQIAMAQLDDITAETEPVNVPATSVEHPNWRRRLSLTLEQLPRCSGLKKTASVFRAERGSTHSAVGRDAFP